jgi:hypothetical protein
MWKTKRIFLLPLIANGGGGGGVGGGGAEEACTTHICQRCRLSNGVNNSERDLNEIDDGGWMPLIFAACANVDVVKIKINYAIICSREWMAAAVAVIRKRGRGWNFDVWPVRVAQRFWITSTRKFYRHVRVFTRNR